MNRTGYDEYKREFVQNWALLISARAGCEPGKGGRGLKDSPLRRLTEKLNVDYGTWQRYKSGKQLPNVRWMNQIHKQAIQLGLLGHGRFLKSIKEQSKMLSEEEWQFWQRYEANPAFQVEEQEEKLYRRLLEIEREAAAIRKLLGLNVPTSAQ